MQETWGHAVGPPDLCFWYVWIPTLLPCVAATEYSCVKRGKNSHLIELRRQWDKLVSKEVRVPANVMGSGACCCNGHHSAAPLVFSKENEKNNLFYVGAGQGFGWGLLGAIFTLTRQQLKTAILTGKLLRTASPLLWFRFKMSESLICPEVWFWRVNGSWESYIQQWMYPLTSLWLNLLSGGGVGGESLGAQPKECVLPYPSFLTFSFLAAMTWAAFFP